MRLLGLSMFILLMSIPVYADDFYPDIELSQLQLIQVHPHDNSALIRDNDGNEAQIFLGDRIGAEAGEVIKVGVASITLRTSTGRTKMPVLHGIIEPQQ